MDVSQHEDDDGDDGDDDDDDELGGPGEGLDYDGGIHPDKDDGPAVLQHMAETEDIFHFVNIQGDGDIEPTPLKQTHLPQSRALDDEDDQQVVDVDETAGKMVGHDVKLYDKWKQMFRRES